MRRYVTTSSIGTSVRCGVNYVVLEEGTALIPAADVQAWLEAKLKEAQKVHAPHVTGCLIALLADLAREETK